MDTQVRQEKLLPLVLFFALERAKLFNRRFGLDPDNASPHIQSVMKMVRLACDETNPWVIDFHNLKPTDKLADVGAKSKGQNFAGFCYTSINRAMVADFKGPKRPGTRSDIDIVDKHKQYVEPEITLLAVHQYCCDRLDDAIVDLRATGITQAEVAEKLGISTGAVSTRLSDIHRRMVEGVPVIRDPSERPGGRIVSMSHSRGPAYLRMCREVGQFLWMSCTPSEIRRIWSAPAVTPDRRDFFRNSVSTGLKS